MDAVVLDDGGNDPVASSLLVMAVTIA